MVRLDVCVHWVYTDLCVVPPHHVLETPVKPTRRASSTPAPKRRSAALAVPSAVARDVRFTARLSRSEKTLLQRAAAGRGQTLSAYVFEKARAAAMAELEAAGEIVLASADQRQFVELLLSPPPLNARMRRALALAKSVADAE